jgi:GntR family transcriptional regulator/MocR family aminotransferase
MHVPVSTWRPALELEPQADEPLYLQIARAVSAEIERGCLRPGTRLPGTRTLAKTLGVHRNTAVSAYAELAAEGWLDTTAASGTFVSKQLPPRPAQRVRAAGVAQRTAYRLHERPVEHGAQRDVEVLTNVSSGACDLRLLPVAEIARAYRRALAQSGDALLGYGPAEGHPPLRAALAALLRTERGIGVDAENVFVCQGAQMGLELVARVLLEPGDRVAVEAFGYPPAWAAFRRAGARLFPVPVDRDGIDVDALERLARKSRLRAIYVTPHHQYPTTAVLPAGRRMRLLELAVRYGIALIEDDYDHEFHYDGRPLLPLASADRAGAVIYVGTLAKVLAPGLRIGFVVAPRDLIARLASERRFLDRQGDHAIEAAVANLIDSGKLTRHTRRCRRINHARRDYFCSELERLFGERLTFTRPVGGIAIWARVADSIDVERWAAAAADNGVHLRTGKTFAFDGRMYPFVRFGFAALDMHEARDALERLAVAAKVAARSSSHARRRVQV